MDLLFKRYASPFCLMDQYIKSGRVLEFINDLLLAYNEDELYKVWLLKINDKSYQEFKEEIEARVEADNFDEAKKSQTIENSKEILNQFELKGGE